MLGDAIAEYMAAGDFQASTAAVYERTLEALLHDLGAGVALERISRARLETHLRARYAGTAPATYNRNLATIGSLFAWVVDADHLAVSPAAKLRRRKENADPAPRSPGQLDRRRRAAGPLARRPAPAT